MSSTNDDEWWNDGAESIDTMRDDEGGDRVFLKAGDKYLFLFLDGDGEKDKKMFDRLYGAPFLIKEYQIPARDGDRISWRNWATSVYGRRDKDGNPAVDHVRERTKGALRAAHVAFFTGWLIPDDVDIEDLLKNGDPLPSGWKKLLAVKKRVVKLLQRIAERRGGYRGLVVSLERDSKEDANSGSPVYECKLNEDDLAVLFPEEEDRTPLAYTEILAPKSKEEIDALLDRWEPQDDDRKDDRRGGSRGGRSGGRSRDRDDDGDGERRGGSRRSGGGGGARRPRNDGDDEEQERPVSSRRSRPSRDEKPRDEADGDSLPF